MITEAHLVPCTVEEISATPFQEALAADFDEDAEPYRIESSQTAEPGWLVFNPEMQRASIAMGDRVERIDATDAEDALRRYLVAGMAE